MTLKPFAIDGGGGVPPEPDWRSLYSDVLDVATAHEEWGLVVRELQDAGTLAICNGHAVKRLVEFRVQYERASRQVAETGAIVKAKRTKVPAYSPYWVVMRQADEAIRVLEAELGLAPVRRGKATKVQRAKKNPRAADAYIKPAAG
jgi:P27 family predicted phage terminase small subunit